MELLIPLVALGSLYTVSKQNGNNKESFVSMGKPANLLPNVNLPVENYPALNKKEFLDSDVKRLPSNIESTNRYLNQNEYFNKEKDGVVVGTTIQQTHSFDTNANMSASSNDFVHHNKLGIHGKLRERPYNHGQSTSILDSYSGNGSHYLKKTEQAPLFAPQKDIQWTHGTPNASTFIQSRINPVMKNNMVKPFETIKVGKGYDQGTMDNGCGGYNMGMNNRDRTMPKTVDELRNAAKPKEEHMILDHEGPANAQVKSRGIIGEVKKYRPDTFFINSQDRWFTTTGAEIAGQAPSTQIVKNSNRNDCSTAVIGHAHAATQAAASVAPQTFTEPKRFATDTSGYTGPSYAQDQAPISNNTHKSYTTYTNNRAQNNQPNSFGAIFSKSIEAAVAPIMDVLKPCRKEEYVCNARVFGNMGTGEISAGYTQAPEEAKTTVKETTLYSSNGYIGNQGQGNGAYQIISPHAEQTQRDITGECGYMGGVGGAATTRGNMPYTAAYNRAIDDKKEATCASRNPNGNTQVFSPHVNMNITKQDAHDSGRVNAPGMTVAYGPSTQTYGKQVREIHEYDQNIQNDRINPAIISALKSNPYTHVLSNTTC